MNDQFGREVGPGDQVSLKGTVVGVNDLSPYYLNCWVQLDQPMPPSGAQIHVGVNTQMVEMTKSAQTQRRIMSITQQIGQIKQLVTQLM